MRRIVIYVLLAAAVLAAVDPQAATVTRKLDVIQNGQAKPGSVFHFSASELNAWTRVKVPTVVPRGVRQPQLRLGNGTATGSALIDFLKVRNASGIETSWLLAKLIEGEKPVTATAQIRSANGQATVHLTRVEIGGIAVSGSTLDFMVRTFLLPLYPNARIDQPFELADRVERIEVTPGEARVYIKK